MANTVQHKRGTTAQVSSHTGAVGEFIYNTTTKRIHAQDGVTAGGVPHALVSEVNLKANESVTISAGAGLTGGGTLAANRTLSLSSASIASLALADSAVQSVNGKTGSSITLTKADVGLGNVDNTSDANKPVSTATQTALNAKANSSVTVSAGTGLTGGGNLTANRSVALNSASIASLGKADTALQAPGGTTGQILAKNSADDNDVSWVTSEAATAVSYGPQTLTPEQQEQTLNNISAVHSVLTSRIITVGSGGDFSTLNEALSAASKMRPEYISGGVSVEVRLLSGFTMGEQVFLSGADLSAVTITSVDAVVPINTDGMTQTYKALFEYAYMFCFARQAKSPLIAVQFEKQSGTQDVVGFMVVQGATCSFACGSGARGVWKGLHASMGSYVTLNFNLNDGEPAVEGYGVDFSFCSHRALDAYQGCHITLPQSLFHHSGGDYGVFLIYGSKGDFRLSDASYCTNGIAFAARDNSSMNVRDTNASFSDYGYYAIHDGRINARSHGGTSSGLNSANAEGCRIGVHLNDTSSMSATDINVRNCGRAFQVYRASLCNADYAVGDGSQQICAVTDGSTLNLGLSNFASITGTGNVISAENCSTVNFSGSGSGVSTISATSTAQNNAIDALEGSKINLNGCNINLGNGGGIRAAGCSDIVLDYATITSAGILSQRGSRVGLRSATNFVANTGANHITIFQGGIAYLSGMSTGSGSPARRINVDVNVPGVHGLVFA